MTAIGLCYDAVLLLPLSTIAVSYKRSPDRRDPLLTLIFSHVNPRTGLFAGSDIVLSTPAMSKKSPVKIPFRAEPFKHEASPFSISSLGQKTVIFGKTMIQWAGWQIVARKIISDIIAASNDGMSEVSLDEIVAKSGLSDRELSGTSIIYHYHYSEDVLVRNQFNCQSRLYEDGRELIVSGSGVWHFFDDLFVEGRKFHEDEAITVELIAKIVSNAILESGSNLSLDHLYGGWIEIIHKGDDAFKKMPYAIKMWGKKDNIILSGGPAFFGFYLNGNLIISESRPPGSSGKKSPDQIIPPMFKGDNLPREPVPIKPMFIAHVVRYQDSGLANVLIDNHPSNKTMTLEADPNGLHVRWSSDLVERLRTLKTADNDLFVDHRFSDL